MRPPHQQIRQFGQGTVPIAIGIVALIASAYVPGLPVASAMALVATGATGALCSRLAKSQLAATAIALQVFVYLSLYFVFVGAVIHGAMSGTRSSVAILLMMDLGASFLLMALVVQKAIATVLGALSP